MTAWADKTHTASSIRLYESTIVWGAVLGCLFSVLPIELPSLITALVVPKVLLVIFGFFSGNFVGCFAIAIAEMLNTIPIFSRRISMGKGMGTALLFLALGKTAGSLLYFIFF
ncbi:MAG: stage V sporulation protein AB [Clostridia bacterium]|nr:stage V sporulation protein AB [Clostridia bacterium]